VSDNGRKVLVFADFAGDVLAAGEAHNACGVHAVFVAVLGRHKAVGGQQDGAVEGVKFFLLLPPRVAVVALEVAELLESGVVVGGQHFGVGVHVHARTFGLLEQHLQVAQIVAGNQDAGVGAHANVDLGDLGIAVGTGVGGIKQSHNAYALVAGFKGQGHEIGHGKAVVQGLGQSFLQEVVHGGIMLAQHIGMLGIGGHALEAKRHEPAQGTNIVIACGKNAHSSSLGEHGGFVVRFPQGSVGQPVARAKLGHQGFLGGTGLAHALGDHVIVKVGIGDGAKKVAHDHAVDFVVHGLAQGAHFGPWSHIPARPEGLLFRAFCRTRRSGCSLCCPRFPGTDSRTWRYSWGVS